MAWVQALLRLIRLDLPVFFSATHLRRDILKIFYVGN